MNTVDICVTDFEPPPWNVEVFILKALELQGKDNWDLSVVFCSKDFIRGLNAQYRGLDEPTDVLSFRQETDEIGFPQETLEAFALDEPTAEVVSLTETGSPGHDLDTSPAVDPLPVIEGRYIAGDIVISLEVLRENADYFSIPEEEELRRLLVHGILHLDGMDHATNEATEPMLQLQEELLRTLAKEARV